MRTSRGVRSTLLHVQSLAGFLLVWAVTVLVVLVFNLPTVQSFLANNLSKWIGLIFGASLGISIAQYVAMSYVLTYKDTIVYRRLYDIADLWFTALGIFAGLMAAALRVFSVVPLLVVTFTRSDLTVLPPSAATFLDYAHVAFRSFFLQHAHFGNPLRVCATLILRQGAEEFSRRLASARGDRHAARKFIPGTALQLASTLRRLSGVADAQSPLPRAWSFGGPSPPGPPADDAALQTLLRRQRARNRWHLALILSMHPRLRFSRNHERGPRNGASALPFWPATPGASAPPSSPDEASRAAMAVIPNPLAILVADARAGAGSSSDSPAV